MDMIEQKTGCGIATGPGRVAPTLLPPIRTALAPADEMRILMMIEDMLACADIDQAKTAAKLRKALTLLNATRFDTARLDRQTDDKTKTHPQPSHSSQDQNDLRRILTLLLKA